VNSTKADVSPLQHTLRACVCVCVCLRTPLCLQYKENLELRMKYADNPEKFLDSEVDLDEQVKTLLQVRLCVYV